MLRRICGTCRYWSENKECWKHGERTSYGQSCPKWKEKVEEWELYDDDYRK